MFGGLAARAHQHLDQTRIGEHEHHLVVGQGHGTESESVQHGGHLHGMRDVENVLLRPQHPFRQRHRRVPLLATSALVTGAQERGCSVEEIIRVSGLG